MMGYVDQLQVHGTFVRESKFLHAITKMVEQDTYDHESLLKALKKNKAEWKQQVKKADYIAMMDHYING